MDYKKLGNEILDYSKDKVDNSEVYIVENRGSTIKIYEGEIDKYSLAESGGISFRALKDGKIGYSYTERIDRELIPSLVADALENSKYMDGEMDIINRGEDNYRNEKFYSENLEKVSIEKKIELLKDVEKKALGIDPRIKMGDGVVYFQGENTRYIKNTKGLDVYEKNNSGYIYVSLIAQEKGEVHTGMAFKSFREFEDLDLSALAHEAVKNALEKLGSRKIKSGKYRVLFENKTFASLLEAFIPAFIGENVQKDMSLLKGKRGTIIGSHKLNIKDNALLKDGFNSRNFDDEGTTSKVNNLVENGRLNMYLHNLKTANKEGGEVTGNASRSYRGAITTRATNFYIERGLDEIKNDLKELGRCIYINDLQGLHSGLNPISGDFSLSAGGKLIESGNVLYSINQFTVAGNFFQLLKDIEAIGGDLEFTRLGGENVGSPSILVKELFISGK